KVRGRESTHMLRICTGLLVIGALMICRPALAATPADSQTQIVIDVQLVNASNDLLKAVTFKPLFQEPKRVTQLGVLLPEGKAGVQEVMRKSSSSVQHLHVKVLTLNKQACRINAGGPIKLPSANEGYKVPLQNQDVRTEIELNPTIKGSGKIWSVQLDIVLRLSNLNCGQGIVTPVGFVPGFYGFTAQTSVEVGSDETVMVYWPAAQVGDKAEPPKLLLLTPAIIARANAEIPNPAPVQVQMDVRV